jgi:iron complex transport system ATP-binding protein
MTGDNTILTTHRLAIGYRRIRRPDKVISANLSLTLGCGELVCVLGPNGAGKSTLLRTLSGMQPALGGRITLMGQDIRRLPPKELARQMSVVLTDRVSAGALSAYELVALGRYPYTGWMGQLTERDQDIVRWAFQAVGAVELAGRSVGELSDGERQKIMIARALAQNPRAILLDEPTAFLDLPHRVEVMRALRHLARTTGRAILLSTHDLDLALRSADRIWLMAADGSIQVGAPEDLVLSGAFQATFQREGVEFDACTGSFTIEKRQAGSVHLTGDGMPALWTARALEREGFRVDQNGSPLPIRVEVLVQDSRISWRCATPTQTSAHESIQALLDFLRHAG